MGFAETGASLLKNNRLLKKSRPRMNDSHFEAENSLNEKDHPHHKMSKEELEEFRSKLINEKKRENRKTIIILISLISISILMVIVVLSISK